MFDIDDNEKTFDVKQSKERRELLQDLFQQYKIEGLTPKQAMLKAKAVLMSFKNN